MSRLRALVARLVGTMRRGRLDRDLQREIHSHLEDATDEYVRQGLSRPEARRRALLRFGGVTSVREAYGATGGFGWLDGVRRDLQYAARSLRRSPALAAVVVVTLALGIGATTALFSVVDALLFKPLPYPHAERLYAVTLADETLQGYQYWPHPKYAAFARLQSAFDETAAYARSDVTVVIESEPRRVEAEVVSAGYFPLVGQSAALGRVFGDSEGEVPGRDAVVVLSDALWRSAFHGDARVVGRTVLLKDRPYAVVGVMPPSFRGQTGAAEIWLPVMMAEHFLYEGAATKSAGWWMRVVARLAPEMTEASASAGMPALTGRVYDEAPSILKSATRNGQELFQLVPFKAVKVNPGVRRTFVMLLVAVGLVLLITCANTANLLLGRAVSRQPEFAIRRALGASQATVVRQLMVEGLVLAALSGVAALLVSMWTLEWLAVAKPLNVMGFRSGYALTFDYFSITLAPRVLVVHLAVSLCAGLLVSLLPAREAAGRSLIGTMGRSAAPVARFAPRNARNALVVAEIALSLMLLAGAGLMLKSVERAMAAVTLGFEPDGLVAMTAEVQTRRPAQFYRDLLERVRAIPGAREAAISTGVPIRGTINRGTIAIDGPPEGHRVLAGLNVISPEYFQTLRIGPVAGRMLSHADREAAQRVAVVSRSFARAAWPGQDPLGRRVRHSFRLAFGDPGEWTTVVGVVDDVVYGTLDEPRAPMVYLSAWQPLGTPAAMSNAPTTITVRPSTDTAAIVTAIRENLRRLDPGAPLSDILTMSERAADITAGYRYSGAMMSAGAALALVLALIGTYSVMAYAVATRTREIGIRIALGARAGHVLRLVAVSGLKLTAAGLALGFAGALAGSRVLASLLYGVSAHDPVILLSMGGLTAAVALAATCLPAVRATRVDPLISLRDG